MLASRPATTEEFLEALSRCETALDALDNGVRIYRGVGSEPENIRFKPQMSQGYRKSANTDNYYTLILDHMESWKPYPPRSASVIATLDRSYARGYGTPYLLIPEGNPNVGVCASRDFWDSFRHMIQTLSLDGPQTMDDFNICIRNALRVLIPKSKPTTYSDLMKHMQQVIQVYPHMTQDQKKSVYEISHVFWQYFVKHGLIPGLDELLNPDKNDFVHHTWDQLDAYKGHDYEVWFSAPVWMISMPHDSVHTKANLISQVQSWANTGDQRA